MPPRINYTSEKGASRWITISLVALVLVAAGFAALAFYTTRYNQERSRGVVDLTNTLELPPPPQYSCPLDGTIVTDQAETSRRPIVVQVDNAPQARPQSGLSQADIIYEAMAEGDITRFSAIYACHEVETIGPVRSARLINLELVPEYSALLANSGSSMGVSAELEAAALPNINEISFPQAFQRTGDRFAPHNLMTSTMDIRNAAASVGLPVQFKVTPLAFKDDTPAPAVTNISVPLSGIVDVRYQYDPATNGWLRFLNGEAHIDALTEAQLTPKNVIIQYVDMTESDIEEDVGGNRGLIFGLTGSGPVQVFRDGQAISGTWKRQGQSDVTSYVDAAGQPIALNRGLTFIQLVPKDFQVGTG